MILAVCLGHYHDEIFSVVELLQIGSHLVSQYFGLFTDIRGVICKHSLPNTSCTQAAPCHHAATSMSDYLDYACSSVQVHTKIDKPDLD